MSGIFGFITYSSENRDNSGLIRKMFPWNRIYGNSYEGYYEEDRVSLGCCIENLSDINLQKEPVLRYAEYISVIDAVLYNRDELEKKCDFDTNISDAELLLRCIIHFGPDVLNTVNGDFAGIIYDSQEKTLLLFRDHMGIRPLFYYVGNGIVSFSTDLRGLVALPVVDASLSEEWIYKVISEYYSEQIDNTPYENIMCVTPASYITFCFRDNNYKMKKKRYWRLRKHKVNLPDEKAYQRRLRELIVDSVRCRLDKVSGPVGAELSGGLDSGVIDILINRAGRKGIYYSWSLNPKELRMADNDERLVIEDICKQENITCTYSHMDFDYGKTVSDRMTGAGIQISFDESNDYRYAFPSWSNTYTLFRGAQVAAENGAKVIFTGHGGDEGVSHRCTAYEMYHFHEYYRYLRHIWSLSGGHKRHFLKTISKSYKIIKGKKRLIKESSNVREGLPELINPEFAKRMFSLKPEVLVFDHDPVKYIESGGSRNRLDNIALYGALCKIRYMVPFLDYRVIDYAVSIPRYLYLKGKTNRYIYREAFKDIMPESMYKINTKEDTSYRNIEPNADWYESYSHRKTEIINKLDRKYWNKYLNFQEIDKLANSGKPNDEELYNEKKKLSILLKCSLAQNLVEKARNITL